MKKTLIVAGLIGLFVFPKTLTSCVSAISVDDPEPPRRAFVEENPLADLEVDRINKLVAQGMENIPHPELPRAKIKKHRYPLPQELLKPEIKLTDACKNVVIKEWRGTKPTKHAVKIVDETCNRAIRAFFPFVINKGYTLKNTEKKLSTINICLLPWKTEEGEAYRSLNDIEYRFNGRDNYCDEYGKVCEPGEKPLSLMAFADRYNRWIFIMNDVYLEKNPVYPVFGSVFSHELFHMWSFHYGVFFQHPGNNDEQIAADERLVREFTAYLGYEL